MQVCGFLVVLLAAVAFAEAGFLGGVPATVVVRAPAFDTAIVNSQRVGNDFAYSTIESKGYAAFPQVAVPVVAPYVYSHPTLLLAK